MPAGGVTMTLDTREFDAALAAYVRASRRELPVIINKVAKDVALRACEFMPKASKEAIKSLPDKSWWPKYVAKILSTHGVTIRRSKTVKQGGEKKRVRFLQEVKGHYTRAQARSASRRIIAGRSRGISFLASAFAKIGKAFGGNSRFQRDDLTRARGWGLLASDGKLEADLLAQYDEKTAAKKAGAERIAMRALQEALDFKAQDMWEYVKRKLREHGDTYSSQRAK